MMVREKKEVPWKLSRRGNFLFFHLNHSPQYCGQTTSDRPFRIVRFELSQVRDVADMVAGSIGFSDRESHAIGTNLRNQLDALENGSRVFSPPPKIVNLSRPRFVGESFEGPNHISTLDLVPHLFPFVAENGVGLTGNGHMHEVGEKAMKFYSRMRQPGEASASKYPHLHPKVATKFLSDDIGRCFGGSEKRMQGLVDSARFVDSVIILFSSIFPARFPIL